MRVSKLPRYLVKLGVEHLLPPVPTLDGDLHDPGDPFSFVVYPFVEGRTGGQGGLTRPLQIAVGRLMRRIHDTDVDDRVTALMRREMFEPPSLQLARRIGELVRSDQPEDAFQRAFRDLWLDHEWEIDHMIGRTEALGADARDRTHAFVICHADIHAWNVLVQASGDFVVVDWDEALMAPRERDLMFVRGGVGGIDNDLSGFFEGYGDVDIDPVLIAFYRFDWVVQELADYGRRVFLMPELGDESRAAANDLFAGLFDPGGVVEAAHVAERVLGR